MEVKQEPVKQEVKACFGQLANLDIQFSMRTKKHYLREDKEKRKECATCNLFSRCMYLKYNSLMQEMLQMIDAAGEEKPKPS